MYLNAHVYAMFETTHAGLEGKLIFSRKPKIKSNKKSNAYGKIIKKSNKNQK